MLESCNSDGAVELDKDSVLNFLTCLKHAMLLGTARLSVSRRELVLKKINPLMVSLAQEHFPDTERHLFGPNFEQRLKTRSETAETIGKAPGWENLFFVEGPPEDSRDLVGAASRISTDKSAHSNQLWHSGAVLHSGVEDNPPDSRAHGSTAHGSSNPISQKPTSNQFAQRYVFRNFTTQFNTEGASNWASKSLHPTMDDAHTGPVGFANHSGSSHRIYESSCSAFLARNAQSTPSTGEGVRSGNERTMKELQTHTPSNRGFISSIFIVPKKDGRNHPVINLKPLNQFLIYEHFKMEGIHMLRDLLKQNDYLVKIDLKDAYLTVPIWKDHQKYLRFLWKGTLHEFACLPFGLATAPRVFTKLMKPVVAALRQRGIRLIIYLDDMLIMAESQALASHHATSTLNLLEEVQLQLVNYNKSQLTPCQSIEFLGFLINSTNLTLQLPGEKLRKIRKTCQDLLEKTEISVRELSKFLGFLTSSIQAIFPGPLHYRHLQRLNNTTMTSEQSYEAILTLDSAAREEVLWWRDHLQGWNGKALFQHPIDLIIEADASRKGWGAYCEGVSTGGPWCSEKKRLHINCLEQLAGSFAIKTFTKTTACAHVRLLLDNAAAVAYINKMGGYSFTCFSQSSNRPVGVVSRESTDSVSSTPPGKIKHTSRQGIEDFNRLERLETQFQPVSSNIENMGPTRNRSLCITPDISASSLCQLEARSSSHTDRCIHNELAKNPRVRLPAIRLNRPMLTAGHVSESRTINSNISSLANSALVSTTTPTVYRSSHSAPSISRSLNERQPATSSGQPPAGWLETVCQRFETTNVSAETREILLAAWRRNTTSAYSSAWSKWVGWCGERKINPVSVSLNAILEFLKDQFKNGKAYRTINVYRSALSTVLPEIDATSMGAHPFFHLRPPDNQNIRTLRAYRKS